MTQKTPATPPAYLPYTDGICSLTLSLSICTQLQCISFVRSLTRSLAIRAHCDGPVMFTRNEL